MKKKPLDNELEGQFVMILQSSEGLKLEDIKRKKENERLYLKWAWAWAWAWAQLPSVKLG